MNKRDHEYPIKKKVTFLKEKKAYVEIKVGTHFSSDLYKVCIITPQGFVSVFNGSIYTKQEWGMFIGGAEYKNAVNMNYDEYKKLT